MLVGIRFRAAKAVVEVGCVEDDAEFGGTGGQCAEECDGVGSAREPDGEAEAWTKECGVERQGRDWKRRWRQGGHMLMVEHGILHWLCRYS